MFRHDPVLTAILVTLGVMFSTGLLYIFTIFGWAGIEGILKWWGCW